MNHKIIIFKLLLIQVVFFVVGCNSGHKPVLNNETYFPNFITINKDKFVDNNERQVILNGINIVSKNKDEGYIFRGGPELYSNLKKWGVNCIRFIVIWDRLEPIPGEYDEEYLKEIDQVIAWAKANNIFIVLDMHQDLFSVKYSDGAPEWATLSEGRPHTTGAVWSDAYMISEAVQTAFDNFWENKPASDGVGLQDHYAAMWKHLAKRYANNTTVIGYDIMNEPFPGSLGVRFVEELLTAYGELHYKLTGEILSETQLMLNWADEIGRKKMLELIASKENYSAVISRLNMLNKEFERSDLQKMYQKLSEAIREVDSNHILFLEHSYFGNMGVGSGIERTSLLNGKPDPLVAYAPHGYDLLTDTEAVASTSNDRVAYIYDIIKQKGDELKMPIWLGEWGAFYGNSTSVIPVAKHAMSLIEKHLIGNAYWSYDPKSEDLEYFKQVLIRSYPVYTSGELISYKNDFKESIFEMTWIESATNNEPTVIYVPHLSNINEEQLKALENLKIERIQNSDAGWLIVPVLKKGETRILKLEFID